MCCATLQIQTLFYMFLFTCIKMIAVPVIMVMWDINSDFEYDALVDFQRLIFVMQFGSRRWPYQDTYFSPDRGLPCRVLVAPCHSDMEMQHHKALLDLKDILQQVNATDVMRLMLLSQCYYSQCINLKYLTLMLLLNKSILQN